MEKRPYNETQLHELLYQALETERGGAKIYEAALTCAQNKDLRGEWEEYLEQTRTRSPAARGYCIPQEEMGSALRAVELGRRVNHSSACLNAQKYHL